METNCMDESGYGDWDSKPERFSFDDDDLADKDLLPYLVEADKIKALQEELRQEDDSASLSSVDSGGSSYVSSIVNEGTLRELGLPLFLLATSPGDIHYESRLELKLASFKTPSLHSEESRSLGPKSIKQTIQALLLGQEVSLEAFRSFSDKKALLIKAVEVNDGNAITAIVLFLKQTLRDSLFHHMLMENKSAANHYIRYLEIRSETAKLADILCLLGRTEDALILRYRTILRSTNVDRLQTQLNHFYTAECCNRDDYIAKMVRDNLNLIDTHKILLQGKTLFNPVENSSVLATLKYISEYNYDQEQFASVSPGKFRNIHNLTEKQYVWTCLSSLTKIQKWPQIESLLLKKTLMGTSLKCVLPPEDVCEILKNNAAPIDLLSVFVCLIGDSDRKLKTAKRLKCHKVVFDIYASKKDIANISTYKLKLEEKSKDAVYAERILKTMR